MPNAQPKRCSWVNVDQVLMREYHDREWGVPAHDDRTHFEFLILEAAAASTRIAGNSSTVARDRIVGKPCVRSPPRRASPTRSAAI